MTRLSYDAEQQLIADTVANFAVTGTFGLRAFPDLTFRLAHIRSHFVSEGEVQLVVDVLQPDGSWANFGRNTPAHIRRELLPCPRCGRPLRTAHDDASLWACVACDSGFPKATRTR